MTLMVWKRPALDWLPGQCSTHDVIAGLDLTGLDPVTTYLLQQTTPPFSTIDPSQIDPSEDVPLALWS
jgi:hypothetical protein